ncbi:MAG: hypothetical protein ACTSUE_05020 [Promethearchaeota archaeon]
MSLEDGLQSSIPTTKSVPTNTKTTLQTLKKTIESDFDFEFESRSDRMIRYWVKWGITIVLLILFSYDVVGITSWMTKQFEDTQIGFWYGGIATCVLLMVTLPLILLVHRYFNDWELDDNGKPAKRKFVGWRAAAWFCVAITFFVAGLLIVNATIYGHTMSYVVFKPESTHDIHRDTQIVIVKPEHAKNMVVPYFTKQNVSIHYEEMPTIEEHQYSSVHTLMKGIGVKTKNEASMPYGPEFAEIGTLSNVLIRFMDGPQLFVENTEWILIMNNHAKPRPGFVTTLEILMDKHMSSYDMIWLDARGYHTYRYSYSGNIGCCMDAALFRVKSLHKILKALNPDDGVFISYYRSHDDQLPSLDALLAENCNVKQLECVAFPVVDHM